MSASMMDRAYAPLCSLADIEAIERKPLEERITRWDFALNLIDGCRIDPTRPAIHATRLGDVDGPLLTWTFADLERRSVQIANFLRHQGVRANDAVAIVSPTVPGLFATMIGQWRKEFDSEFSFYFVQIAPFNYGGVNSAYLREA